MDADAYIRGKRPTFASLFGLAAMVGAMTPKPKPASTTPRGNRMPHQGARETARRLRQMAR